MGTKRKARKAEAASNTSSSSADHTTSDYSGGGGWSSLPWKSLASATAGDTDANTSGNDGDGDGIMFDEEDVGYNHYDDPDAADWSELYGDPATTAGGKKRGGGKGRDRSSEVDSIEGADDPGILLGLEVVDGSLYEVKREKVGEGGAVARVVATVNAGPSESSAAAPAPAKTPNKKKRKLVEAATLNDDGLNSDVDSASDPDGGDDDKAALAEIQKEIRRLKKKARRKQAKLRKKEMKKKQLDEKDTATTATTRNNESNQVGKSGNEEELGSTAEPTEHDINTIRTSWSIAAPGVYLHDVLCRGLALQGFAMPTPIQASTLPASILGRRDIVGAAPTGSGKTLAYAIPMLQGILAARDSRGATSGGIGDKNDSNSKSKTDGAAGGIEPLTGLVLCPTRELVVQVTSEIRRVGCNEVEVGTIVGGLAEQKQKRVLDVKRPPILVATPGRLWELMSSNDHSHLQDLTNLRYLVVDEADRMISVGSFPQLTRIFDMINKANPPPKEEETSDDDDDEDDPERLRSLPGIRGEARVTMLDDTLLAMIRKHDGGDSVSDDDDPPPEPQEKNDDDFREQLRQQERRQQCKMKVKGSVHRQTFVYSATLTLPPSSHHSLKAAVTSRPNKQRKKRTHQTVDGAIAEIMDRAGARGQMKVVDLTHSEDGASSKKVSDPESSRDAKAQSQRTPKLPPGLSLYQVKCTQLHKDMHLYAYLTTTKIGSSGPCLVFCNSVAAVRRIGETLKTLRLPVRTLHAQMAQKARMSALEWINKPESRSIVVATDVAARGLDIPSVATVVHYDVPRALDTFIHRSGRTARGVGAKAVGSSISLVSPSEEKAHRAICGALHGSASNGFEMIPMDGRLLSAAQERTNLAARIVECENIETKAHKNNKWFIEAAEDAGFDLDEDLLDGGLMDGGHRDRQKLSESRKARQTLNELLAVPMRTQQFGKFLSGAGLKAAIQAEHDVSPYIVRDTTTGGKQKRNKKRKKQKFS